MVPYSEKTKEKRPPSEINIGMQKGTTYLGEMYKVYVECYKVLKPGSFMILVVKNFRRKGEEINLSFKNVNSIANEGGEVAQKYFESLKKFGASVEEVTEGLTKLGNRSQASWTNSPAGQNIMRSYGFTEKREETKEATFTTA